MWPQFLWFSTPRLCTYHSDDVSYCTIPSCCRAGLACDHWYVIPHIVTLVRSETTLLYFCDLNISTMVVFPSPCHYLSWKCQLAGDYTLLKAACPLDRCSVTKQSPKQKIQRQEGTSLDCHQLNPFKQMGHVPSEGNMDFLRHLN